MFGWVWDVGKALTRWWRPLVFQPPLSTQWAQTPTVPRLEPLTEGIVSGMVIRELAQKLTVHTHMCTSTHMSMHVSN